MSPTFYVHTSMQRTWNDAFKLCAHPEAAQGLLVRCDDVLRTARVLQPGVLGADAGVIETGTDGVRLDDLTCARLQDVRADTVEHAGDALAKRGGVVITIKACKGMENERGLAHE